MFKKIIATAVAATSAVTFGQLLVTPAGATEATPPAIIKVGKETGTTFAHGHWYCNGHLATIVGTEGNDSVQGGGEIIEGTDGPDVIVALEGHDYMNGWGGNDIICGGPGSDDLYGYSGDDLMFGEADNDSLEGNSGSDTLYLGGTGEHAPWWAGTLRDGNIAAGDYTIWHEGPAGDDVIIGGAGTDGCIRSKGDWKGVDMMSGNSGDDRLEGRGGNDCMNSQGGNDILIGGSGLDLADGGAGMDICNTEETESCRPQSQATSVKQR